MSIAALAFDLDGTLVDSRFDLATAVNATRQAYGLAALDPAVVVTFVGQGARQLLCRALPESIAGGEFERALEHFLRRYYDVCLDVTRPYPGVEEMLGALQAGFPLAVLTNKPQRHAQKVLAGLQLAPYFRCLVGGDTLPWRKPSPETLWQVAKELKASAEETLLVGDSATDAATAVAAGAPFALVSWGYGKAEELAAYTPLLRLRSPVELVSALGSPAGRSATRELAQE